MEEVQQLKISTSSLATPLLWEMELSERGHQAGVRLILMLKNLKVLLCLSKEIRKDYKLDRLALEP